MAEKSRSRARAGKDGQPHVATEKPEIAGQGARSGQSSITSRALLAGVALCALTVLSLAYRIQCQAVSIIPASAPQSWAYSWSGQIAGLFERFNPFPASRETGIVDFAALIALDVFLVATVVMAALSWGMRRLPLPARPSFQLDIGAKASSLGALGARSIDGVRTVAARGFAASRPTGIRLVQRGSVAKGTLQAWAVRIRADAPKHKARLATMTAAWQATAEQQFSIWTQKGRSESGRVAAKLQTAALQAGERGSIVMEKWRLLLQDTESQVLTAITAQDSSLLTELRESSLQREILTASRSEAGSRLRQARTRAVAAIRGEPRSGISEPTLSRREFLRRVMPHT